MFSKEKNQIRALRYPKKFEFNSTVMDVRGVQMLLDKSFFYPNISAQPCDIGTINWGNSETDVSNVELREGLLWHALNGEAPEVGTAVHCKINRERRWQMSRLHSAAVLVAGLAHSSWRCDVSSCGISERGVRLDFTCGRKSREAVIELLTRCNAAIAKGAAVSTWWIPVRRAEEHVSLYRSAATSRKVQYQQGRVVQIRVNGHTLERQFDIGTHVDDIRELVGIHLGPGLGSQKAALENKGRNHFRIRFHLADL
jgi:misacylated tRNA(Ala) deacylase